MRTSTIYDGETSIIWKLFVLLLFGFSCINTGGLIVFLWLIPIIFRVYYNWKDSALFSLLLIQFRSILNSRFAISIASSSIASISKWIVVFLLAFLLLKDIAIVYNQIGNIIVSLCLFSLLCSIFSLITSSYPTVAVFKIISYIIPQLAIICGIYNSSIDWEKIIRNHFHMLLLLCIGLLLIGQGYYVTKYTETRFFCGILNHPNLLGIVLVLALACFLSSSTKINIYSTIYISIVCFLAFLSQSRGAILWCFAILIIYFIISDNSPKQKIALIYTMLFICLICNSQIRSIILSLLHKYGDTSSITASRGDQFSHLISRIKHSPLIGTGFNVPFIENYRTGNFSFTLVTENGNLILAILGDNGILGFLFFIIAYGFIYMQGNKEKLLLFAAPILASMSEMAFFSTNGNAIYFYFFYGIYIVNGARKNRSLQDNGLTISNNA